MPPKLGNLERKARKKKQTRLTFEPLDQPASSSPVASTSKLTPSKVRYEIRNKTEPSPTKTAKTLATTKPNATTELSDSDDLPLTPAATRNKRDKKGRQGQDFAVQREKSITISDDDGPSDSPDPPPRHTQISGMFSSTARQAVPNDLGGSDSSDAEDSEPLVRKGRAAVAVDSGDSDDDMVTSSAIHKTPKPIVTATPRKRKTIINVDSDSESDINASPIKRRHIQEDSDEDSDKASDASSGGGHFGRRIGAKPRLSDSPPRTTRQQTGKKKHRTEKEKQMELLKRRRAGEKNPVLTESETEEESDDNVHLSDFEDEEKDEEAPKQNPKRTHKKSKHRRASGSVDEEEDFIVDEDEIGVPTSIPLEFTSGYNKPLKDHFTDAVECYIHKKLNPGFTGKKDVFERAFYKLDDKPSGLKSSKYGSSQWVMDFVLSLDARPEYREVRINAGDAEARCEACNRGGHIPTFRISFVGRPYNRTTLEEVQQRDDESQARSNQSDDDESETGTVDALGRHLPSQDREWLVGRFCRNNANKTHLLSHWRYHLYQWVIDNLEAEGELSAQKLVKREKMKPWKRQRYVENVVERWQADDKIKNLFRDYKNSVEALAEEKEQGRWGAR
ncbi:hypothetical protein HYFRA_00008441 [Hymenoscyphus fraxineus]|uniref:DUF4211 domain-containing protein n=1 Tax=Hymenoscyphus fraxineus TaxID=746836 RepID=A0A9N9KM14_9HELO|nr:hypothetical protein HYFRA_00008441 [Hymenoscyphus fraxineus]